LFGSGPQSRSVIYEEEKKLDPAGKIILPDELVACWYTD
jgi:hypothetical protein